MVKKFFLILLFPLLTLFFYTLTSSVYSQAGGRCNGLTQIPFSISPKQDVPGSYTVTIDWSALSANDFKKYKDESLDVQITLNENGARLEGSAGSDDIDKASGRENGSKPTYTIKPFATEQGKHAIEVRLEAMRGLLCTVSESQTIQFNNSNQNTNTTNIPVGEPCLPEIQGQKGYPADTQCPSLIQCVPIENNANGLHTCGGQIAAGVGGRSKDIPETDAELKAYNTTSPDGNTSPGITPGISEIKPAEGLDVVDQINEKYTRFVVVTFIGIVPDGPYAICVNGVDGCLRFGKDLGKSNTVKVQRGDNTVDGIRVLVCGNGPDNVKIDNQCTTDKAAPKYDEATGQPINVDLTKNFFHGGHTYQIFLVEIQSKLPPFILRSVQFYVNHYFPNIFLKSQNGPWKIVASTDWNLIKDAVADIAKTNNMFEIPLGKNPSNLQIAITGRRPGGDKRNNYQLVNEGLNAQYKAISCLTVTNDTLNPNGGTPPFGNVVAQSEASKYGLGVANYLLKINEQINDNQPVQISNNCSGGFTYWHIPYFIEKNKDGFVLKIDPADVKKDPHNSDVSKRLKDEGRPRDPPCTTGQLDDTTRLCKEIPVALFGNISTDPIKFITHIFRIILGLAGFIAVILIIIAGYTLMRSEGDKQKLAAARETITSAILGLLFIIFSLVILQVIAADILKIPGFK